MRKKLIAGNWKMNVMAADAGDLVAAIKPSSDKADVLVCPPFTLLYKAKRDGVYLGAQDVSSEGPGAHTGDVSVAHLLDAGCQYVILGHSERRQDHGETSLDVKRKAAAAIAGGLKVIVCVGETLDERDQGQAEDVVRTQVLQSIPETATGDNTVIAYEPVWAIGTGRTASAADAEAMHKCIRTEMASFLSPEVADGMRILYGGSMKPANAAELLAQPDVDGGLIGGASLKAEEFNAIIDAAK